MNVVKNAEFGHAKADTVIGVSFALRVVLRIFLFLRMGKDVLKRVRFLGSQNDLSLPDQQQINLENIPTKSSLQ